MATCPECDAEIDVHDDDAEEMEIGDPWDCDACGSRLRVANLDPLEFETDEDDDEDDDEEPGAEGEADAEGEGEVDEDDDEAEEDTEGGDWDE
jgi:lysine biosynthesis protein LysW